MARRRWCKRTARVSNKEAADAVAIEAEAEVMEMEAEAMEAEAMEAEAEAMEAEARSIGLLLASGSSRGAVRVAMASLPLGPVVRWQRTVPRVRQRKSRCGALRRRALAEGVVEENPYKPKCLLMS